MGMSQRKAIRVLLAEDDPVVLEALSALINDDPALQLVSAVNDTSAAVEAAARERPDVALVDVRMPGGGGAEAARGIRQRSPETRVLALSAYDDRATVLEMLEAGVVGYLVKGSSIDTIMESIRQAADGQGSLSVEVTGEVIEELVGQLPGSPPRHRAQAGLGGPHPERAPRGRRAANGLSADLRPRRERRRRSGGPRPLPGAAGAWPAGLVRGSRGGGPPA